MKALSFFIIPLTMCSGSSAFALTVSGQETHLPVAWDNAVHGHGTQGSVGSVNLGMTTQWIVTRVADVRDARVASVEAADAVEQKRSVEATRPALSVPPEEISSRSDVGDPSISFNSKANLSTLASGKSVPKSDTSDVLADRSMPPVVEHEGAVALVNEATMMVPGDSTGPVLQTKLASFDPTYMPSTPAPIVVPDAPLTPSIVRRKPEERLALPSSKAVGVHKQAAVKVAKIGLVPVSSQPSDRPHVARVKMIRPAFDASTTSVPETAQIAGLRAMERMQ